ncbi:MAG: DUF1016 N-terminal domain-containing protein [Nitrospira sp.]|nr:DUF1016 N-terminal domain-containing protein [Nitrospira sp.]
MSNNLLAFPEDYANWLVGLKQRISGARQRALLSANEEQIRLYHDIGCDIQNRQSRQGWGAKVIDRLSVDLRDAFPEMKGFSSRNLKYMGFFAKMCPDLQIGQQSAAQLPWFHIVTLLTKISDPAEREWYAGETVRQAWPRTTLELHIKNRLYMRQGAAVNNFEQRLPAVHADLPQMVSRVSKLEAKVNRHLEEMRFAWK